MIDYSANLYDPAFEVIGVPATLSAGTAGEVALTVIDDTRPKRQASGSGVEVSSVAPGAFARMPEIIANGIVPDEFDGAVLTFNGRSWIVRSHEMCGSPNGEDLGKVRFLLKAIANPDSGGGVPIWVPADAKIHIDFLGGRAWSNGAEVAIDTLLGSDPNTENYWGPSSYAPADLTAEGLVTAAVPALIGSALSHVLAGFTIAIQYKYVIPDLGSFTFAVNSADGNSAILLKIEFTEAKIIADVAGGGTLVQFTDSTLEGTVNKVAATITPASSTGRADLSTNGGEAASGTVGEVDWPDDLVAAFLNFGIKAAIQSITLYDPLPDTSGLSALSESTNG